jgi:hypothetical protein
MYDRNTTVGNQGEVMSSINGTIRLQSDSEVSQFTHCLFLIRCSTVLKFDVGSWPVIHAQLAHGNLLLVSNSFVVVNVYISINR